MSMMSILARVDGTENDQAVLDSALQVATRFKGHIEALHVRFDPRDSAQALADKYARVVSGLQH